jgi:hypothetical protein
MDNITALLFYSPHCSYCIECLQELEPYASEIGFIGYVNIHELGKQYLPEAVKRVPCLILNNGELVYTGIQGYEWIKNLISIVGSEKPRQQNNIETKSSLQRTDSFGTIEKEYVNINDLKTTFSDNIDYSKLRLIEPETQKTTLSLDSILEKRNSDLSIYRKNA